MLTNNYAKHNMCFLKQFYTIINLLLLKMKADSDAWMVLIEQSWGAKLMTCSFKCMLQVNLLLQFFLHTSMFVCRIQRREPDENQPLYTVLQLF